MTLAALLACADPNLTPVVGTTARIEPVTVEATQGMEQQVDVFLDAEDCRRATVDDVAACTPWLDRTRGEVRFAFQVRAGSVPQAVSLDADMVDIYHKNQAVKGAESTDFELVPHQPEAPRALYVLLIDGSYSMRLVDQGDPRPRIDKVRDALLDPEVVKAFYENESAVAPFVFESAEAPRPLAAEVVVDDPEAFRQLVASQLQAGNAYTWLYRSVEHGVSTVLKDPRVAEVIEFQRLQPVVIALTDGFNNEHPLDLCRDNAPRLSRLLQRLEELRTRSLQQRPTVWTVGLGRKAWRDPKPTRGPGVSPSLLCGAEAERPISDDLELRGVDNVALTLIARTGGGKSYVTGSSAGLARAFRDAAALRHRWFEVRYRVDPFLLRRAFEARVEIDGPAPLAGAVRFHPHGWLDGPPGEPRDGGWTRPASPARTTLLVLPVLGALVTLGYLPAAAYNLWRAARGRRWFRRRRPR